MYASLQPMEDPLSLECGESIMAKEQTENPKHFGVFFLIFKEIDKFEYKFPSSWAYVECHKRKVQENIFSIKFRGPKYNLFILISRSNMMLVSRW